MSLEFDMSQLKKKLDSLEKKVANKISKESLEAGADVMLKSQKAEAPKDTGKLRDSLGKSKVKTEKGAKKIDIGTMNASEEVQRYGYYQHYGSRGKLGTYWMDEAYQKGINNSIDAIKETIVKGLKE